MGGANTGRSDEDEEVAAALDFGVASVVYKQFPVQLGLRVAVLCGAVARLRAASSGGTLGRRS
jgi:hypothetical protein